MVLSRRELGRMAAMAAAGAGVAWGKPDSRFKGVQIGAITYSFRALPHSAEEILKYCVQLGLSSVELMGDAAESYAGAPQGKQAAEERTKWRLSARMDSYVALRRMYEKAGVRIPIFKLPLTAAMSDAEYSYVFRAAKALGATCITMELPKDPKLSERVGRFAAEEKVYVGYHNHTQVNEQSWDTALAQSPYNSINLDVGHFTEAISKSPLPFIERNHARITSFHLKDKLYGTNGGGNRPWGQGNTPLKEILQTMARGKYRFPANIELEYEVPANSSVLQEMEKCIRYCKDALL